MDLDLKALAKQTCTFSYFRDGVLYYQTDSGFVFGIPVADTGTGTYGRTERGMTLLRWIRKAVEALKADV